MDQSLASERGHVSMLSCFPPPVGRDVAAAVVKSLGAGLGNPDSRSLLRTDRQVKWTMEVLCYGLTLPFDDDTVRLCVEVYADWLAALVSPRDSIPPPIVKEPNVYAQKILRHLHNLFLLRSDQSCPVYLSLCEQVLHAVQSAAKESAVMTRDTWETLLHFLLRINHAMLAPPTAADASQQQLAHLSMAVLFEVWLLSCSRCFPPQPLWQMCRQVLSGCRHQPAAVDQWNRVTAALTSRVLRLNFGPSFPAFKVPEEDAALVPADMEDERVRQTWFRFLHMLSNPADLSRPAGAGVATLAQEEVFRGEAQLPHIFLTAMRGVSRLVDAFLGITVDDKEPTEQPPPNAGLTARTHFRDRLPSLGVAVTRSPFKDRLPSYGISRPRSGSAPPTPINILSTPSAHAAAASSPPAHSSRQKTAHTSKATSKPAMMSSSPHHWKSSSHHPPPCPSPRPSPSPLRCNTDSLLHLFGCWLFDAALINRNSVLIERWAAGRAEACGTLCRIFSCKKTSEDIQPVYLSRFYMVLLQGLQVSEQMCPPVLASILLNCSSLFCCDLRGINLLLPSFISALETVLLDRELLRFKNFVSVVDLRRASILVLLSLLPLPLQFGSVQLEVLLEGQFGGDDVATGSLLSLKPRLIGVLIGALQTETDQTNIQMILAAMLNLVQDSALLEAARQTEQHAESQNGGPSRGRRTSRTSRPSETGQTRGATVQSDTVGVLWVQFVRQLTQRLTGQWRNDSAVCLSVLEALGGLAKVEVSVEESEKKRALSSVCCYIVFQCSRPPPLHSRDLHSIIVAAFYCLNIWLTRHPAMLDHQDCLLEVLEIVELGISGSKSRQDQELRCKEEKELNPASLRVKEAAEATLNCVMQVSGVFPFVGRSVDEDALIGCSSISDSSIKKFRYFVVDTSVILAMLEQPPGPGQVCPSLSVLIRGPSARHAWNLQLHLQPREGRTRPQGTSQTPNSIPERHREAPEDCGTRCSPNPQLLPEKFDRVPPVKADRSVPALSESVSAEMQLQLECVRAILARQRQLEALPQVGGLPVAMATCRPPPPAGHFQTARLFLSHLGLLTPETLKDPGISGVPAQLVALDSSLPGFLEDLRRLDQLPSRHCDCALVFYMRAGQRTAAEILRNVESSAAVASHFLDFLSSLGQPVEAGHGHVGGTGANSPEFLAVLGESGGGVFDGERFALMYSDALTRLTFIIPSSSSSPPPPPPSSPSSSSSSSHTDWSKSVEEAEPVMGSPPERQSQWEFSQDPAQRPTSSPGGEVKSFLSGSKLLIVWVEQLEDIESFPLSELLSESKTETPRSASSVQLIFIHPLKTGLFRIGFQGTSASKFSLVVPLVSGSVVSGRSLGSTVREMAINCCHRRRLESDSASPPHVRRKHVITDIVLRYRSRRSEPAFYSALFQEP